MKENRWFIVAMASLTQLCLGMVYAWSFFQKPLSENYKWSNSETTLAFSLSIFMLGISAAWGGLKINKFGPKKLALTGGLLYALGYIISGWALFQDNLFLLYIGFGVIGGIGLGLAYVTPVATVSKYFPDKQGLATGIVVMGFGLGALLMSKVIAPYFLYLSEQSLPKTFLYIGVLLLLVLPLTTRFLIFPKEEKKEVSVLKFAQVKKVIFSKDYKIIWIIFGMNIMAGMIFISFQSPLLQDLLRHSLPLGTDFSSEDTMRFLETQGANLIAVSSLCNGIGRFFWGSISDKTGRLTTFRLLFSVQILVFISLIFVNSPTLFFILVCVVLLCYGGGFGVIPSLIKEKYGSKLMPLLYGIMLIAWSFAGVIGPQITAFLKDSYALQAGDYAYKFGLITLLIVLLLSFLVKEKK